MTVPSAAIATRGHVQRFALVFPALASDAPSGDNAGMTAALIMILFAGTAGSLAPEPTRSFVASSARAGVTVGAMYFVVGNAPASPPPVHAVPAPAPMPTP